jgi:hypothetical protein
MEQETRDKEINKDSDQKIKEQRQTRNKTRIKDKDGR